MTDLPKSPDSEPHTTARWVKVFGLVALVAVLLVVVMMLAGGGEHGPSRHTPGGNTSEGSTLTSGMQVSDLLEAYPLSTGELTRASRLTVGEALAYL